MFKTLGIESNFLGIEEEYSSFAKSRVVVAPIPYEQTVSYGGGTGKGPEAILKASHYVEFFDEETRREVHKEFGIATLQPLAFGKRKNEKALELIYEQTRRLLQEKKFIVSLGGEHTISQATIAAFAEKYRDLSILQIDAHSDLRAEYQGNPYSHASVMARVCEFVDPRKLVQIGIRAQCIEEAQMIAERKINTFYAHEIRGGKYARLIKSWTDFAIEKLSKNVYVTFDVDGLDPSIMPSTGTPEPNGLFWHETAAFLKRVGSLRKVVGCDIVELAPQKGVHHADLTTAKMVSKMINYFVS